jgi:acyl-CoA synthetase (AMP-forming)/AMP-acid ligase II
MSGPSLYQEFEKSVRAHADRIAVGTTAAQISYGALEQASREVAMTLLQWGVARGDRIAIWGVNSAEWIIAALAIQAVGAVLVPIGTRLRGRETRGILEESDAAIIFCDRRFGDYDYVAALHEMDGRELRRIVVLDQEQQDAGVVTGFTQTRAAGSQGDQAALDRRIAQGDGDDLADIIFTSGTTGKPKGVPMTCAQSLAACHAQQEDISGFTPEDVIAVTFPFAHNAGYRAGWQVALLYGVRVLPISVIDPAALLRLIEAERITYLPTVVAVAQGLIAHPDRDKCDLSSLRLVATGGTTIPVKLVEDLLRHLSSGTVVQSGYGLTETAGSVTATRADDAPEIIVSTVGRPLRSLEVRILNPEGQEVPRGETGEIAVRGPQVLTSYYNDPVATAAAFTPDGFLLTGDAGAFDDGGHLRITDRIKDMYLVGGFNCYPAEIEHVMRQMAGVDQVAVIGVDDERLGQVGKAFVVRSADSTISAEEIIAWCRNEMANYKVPRSVHFLDAMPLNGTGKIAKTDLRALTESKA